MATLPSSLIRRSTLPSLPPRPDVSTTSLLASPTVEDVDTTYVSPLAAPSPAIEARTLPTHPAKATPSDVDTVAKDEAHTSTEAVESRKTTKPKARKHPRKFRYNSDSDAQILTGVYRCGRATIEHIAAWCGSHGDIKRRRVNDLTKNGYLKAVDTDTQKMWSITVKGLAIIGISGNAPTTPAPSTVVHTNKLNTVLTFLAVGDESFHNSRMKAVERKNRNYELHNRAAAEDNARLVAEQARLRAKDPEALTEAEVRYLARRPASMLAMWPVPNHWKLMKGTSLGPTLTIPERFIRRDEQSKGFVESDMSWPTDCAKLLADESFPTRPASEPFAWDTTEAQRAVMDALVSEQGAQVFKHWNVGKKFDKRHTPDGVAVLPHLVDAQGNVTGGSWWIELEDHKKDVAEYMRIIRQAMYHPLVAGVLYFTNHTQIVTRLKQAVKAVITELASANYDHTLAWEQKEALARRQVESVIHILPLSYLNGHSSREGYCG